MKIAIIGAGNMGGATAKGLIDSQLIEPFNIFVTAAHTESLIPFAEMGAATTLDNKAAVKEADIVILALKPWIAPKVIDEIKGELDLDKQVFVTMMPGITPEDLSSMLSNDLKKQPKIIYVIPNTAIEVKQSMTFISPISSTEEETQIVMQLFSTVGIVKRIEYRQLAACTALASCGIAFALRYIRASVEGGVQLGVKASEGQAIVSQTLKGAATLLQQKGTHTEYEIDRVTTPGGFTIKGLNAMEANGFTNAVIEGLIACSK